MFNLDGNEFAMVMLIEELSNSSVSYLVKKFGDSGVILLNEDSSEEDKIVYTLIAVVDNYERASKILKALEKYLRYKRRDRLYNFSDYYNLLSDLYLFRNRKNIH